MLLLLTMAELELSEFFKLTFLKTIKVHRWPVFPNPVTYVTAIYHGDTV